MRSLRSSLFFAISLFILSAFNPSYAYSQDAKRFRPLGEGHDQYLSDADVQAKEAAFWQALEIIDKSHLDAVPFDPRGDSFGDESQVQINEEALKERPQILQKSTGLPNKAHQMNIWVFQHPWQLGFPLQFGLLEIDGKLKNAFVTSLAKPGLVTPSFDDKPQIETIRGLDFPWHLSTISGAEMYWGMRVNGAFWIHSTPYNYEFRKPSSLGCIRTTHPTAMEIWEQATSFMAASGSARQNLMRVKIVSYGETEEIYLKLKKRMGFKDLQIKNLVNLDLNDAMAHNSYVYHGNGHWRVQPNRVFSHITKGYYPKCNGYDCFKVFGMNPRVN